MKMNVGIVLVLAGIGLIVWGTVGYTTQDKVIDIGPIHATKETQPDIPYGPVGGALVLVAGAVLIASARRA